MSFYSWCCVVNREVESVKQMVTEQCAVPITVQSAVLRPWHRQLTYCPVDNCQVRARRDLHSWLTYLLCCTVWVPDLFLDIISVTNFREWPWSRPRAVVAWVVCKSGKVWNVLGVFVRYKWRSFDRSFSFRYDSTIEWLGMCDIFHQFSVGQRVFGDYS